MSTAIKIENVSKLYRLGTVGTGTISHDLNRWWHTIRGKEDPYALVGQVNDRAKAASDEKRGTSEDTGDSSQLATSSDYVWALKDVNLEVAQGEILGIIGRNGAGKSTLLKLLSRVTAPTTGSIKTKGRIASLLEVGTGFHPELTGRENIYMNGAILGMRRHEITKQLDAIIDFSGCAKYVDTPVKRYSSGMMVRLGFAVAAHLDCEILIVDEVLAVGDAQFTRRCVNKMRAVAATNGKTILLVSHNMSSIRSIATSCALIEKGRMAMQGRTSDVISAYTFHSSDGSTEKTPGNFVFESSAETTQFLTSVSFLVNHEANNEMRMGDHLAVKFAFSGELDRKIQIGVAFESPIHGRILSIGSSLENIYFSPANAPNTIVCDLGQIPLNQGLYSIRLTIADDQNHPLQIVDSLGQLEVQLSDIFGHGMFLAEHHGPFFWRSNWKLEEKTTNE